jgi:outer membrane biosynthesis protein TonB
MADASSNQWKLATIGLLIVGATVLITSLVIGRDTKIMPPEEIVQTEEVDTQVAKKEPANKPKATLKIATAPPAPKPAPAPAPKPVYSPQPTHPPQSIIQACNKYASDQVNSKTEEVVKDAGIGALLGAATGAAVGAIAGGGSGAAKGAGIGAIAGGAGGTLYGLNENQTNDARYQEAYSSCMRSRGY